MLKSGHDGRAGAGLAWKEECRIGTQHTTQTRCTGTMEGEARQGGSGSTTARNKGALHVGMRICKYYCPVNLAARRCWLFAWT